MHRLFVALRPPAAIRQRLAEIMAGVPGARWQDDDQLHLSVRFIGTADRPMAQDIVAALGSIHAPAPRVGLAGVGRFERQGRTEAIWAGVAPHDALAQLHKKVDRALVRLGLAPEGRAYLPHITLARLGRRAAAEAEVTRFVAEHGSLASQPFDLTYLTLFSSHLGSEGARYDAVERWPLDRLEI